MTKYVYADPKKGIPDWLPGVERVAGNDSGSVLPGSKWSLLLHTTEGGTLDGAISALRSANAWSHFIYDPKTDRLVQCVSMNRAARSLRSGGNFGKTNAARVIQVEIVGRAHETPFWPREYNERLGRMIRRIANHVPFDVSMPVTFYGDRSGFTVASETARQRMSWFDWYRFDAICGHQHAPKNNHWDPGEIQVGQILAAARAGGAPSSAPEPWKAPAFPGKTLRLGSKGYDVAVLKMLLQASGYGHDLDFDNGNAEVFDEKTAKAVQYAAAGYYTNQKEPLPNPLPAAVGPKLWGWITDVVKVKKANPDAKLPQVVVPWVPPKFPGHTLREGQRSNDVAVLKLLLVGAGYGHGLDLSATGVKKYGAGTSAAVKAAMQAYYKNEKKPVPADLKGQNVGPTTWKWLCDVVAVRKAQEK